MTFKELDLIEPIAKALEKAGYTIPTPIQAEAIPLLLDGEDLLGCAQTGTGKTCAFAIPIIQHIYLQKQRQKSISGIKALVLTPTRELAMQISESFAVYGQFTSLRHTVIFGGVGQQPQVDALRRGVDILVATPGRLLDLMSQGHVKLQNLDFFVLDEADQMLDMGFIHDIKRILPQLPRKRQSLFFSATMPREIENLANTILTSPRKVEVTPPSSTVDKIDQYLYYVENKNEKLVSLLQEGDMSSVLVFTRTKHGADKVAKMLAKSKITAEAIHGNKSQNARQRALNNFKEGKTKVLIATDIAARGIDVDHLSHVVNFELPNVPETYVHRIGRTGRAGRSGVAISFCRPDEMPLLRDIEKLIGKKIEVAGGTQYTKQEVAASVDAMNERRRNNVQRNIEAKNKRRSSEVVKSKDDAGRSSSNERGQKSASSSAPRSSRTPNRAKSGFDRRSSGSQSNRGGNRSRR